MITSIPYKDGFIKNHFRLYEFRGSEPHFDLLLLLNLLRIEIGVPVYIVTRGGTARSIQEHILIYQNLFGQDWMKVIPWNSRHLPKHGEPALRAADIYVKNFSGYQLREIINKIRPKFNVGIGYGENKLHIDVDRPNGTKEWCYDR